LKVPQIVRLHNEERNVIAAKRKARARGRIIAEAVQRPFMPADRGDLESGRLGISHTGEECNAQNERK